MDYQMRKVMFSSNHSYHRTPLDLYKQLDSEFHFDIDVCADLLHPLGSMYAWTGEDGLKYSWKGLRCYCNPPYARKVLPLWLGKMDHEAKVNRVMTVALLPFRPDTNWFWDYCINREIRVIKGRIKFSNMVTGAPFPSCIVIFK